MTYHRGPCGGGTSKATNPLRQTIEHFPSTLSIYWISSPKHVRNGVNLKEIGLIKFPSRHLSSILTKPCYLCYKVWTKSYNKTCTCSGERVKDLFPIVNETSGMNAMLSQLTNDLLNGFGSFSHNFTRKKFTKKGKNQKNF